jgi:2-haloacid dehalogenase
MLDRRNFLLLTAGGALASGTTKAAPLIQQHSRFKAVAFDAFPIFDPRPIATLAESLFPGQGAALTNAWRTRQFDYQWLRVLSGQYTDFLQATEDSLVFTGKQLQLDLSADKRQQLMSAWSNLAVWPDVPEAIAALQMRGLRLVFLSNMTTAMLAAGLEKAHLRDAFDAVLSTDQIRSYKPDPRAYQMALDHLHLPREEILFVAFAGWDVAGAKWFGYPTFWLNRLNSPAEELGMQADATGQDMHALVQFLTKDESER